jgi:hypothetical protein
MINLKRLNSLICRYLHLQNSVLLLLILPVLSERFVDATFHEIATEKVDEILVALKEDRKDGATHF